MSEVLELFDEPQMNGGSILSVLARIHVLPSGAGGRSRPFTARYRPNHNFGSVENRDFFIGQVEVSEGNWVHPGETRDLVVNFLNVAGLAEQLTPGRIWRIQEGSRLVATAQLLAVVATA